MGMKWINGTGTPLAPPGLQRTIALAHRKDVHPTHAAQAFHETLLESVDMETTRSGTGKTAHRVTVPDERRPRANKQTDVVFRKHAQRA